MSSPSISDDLLQPVSIEQPCGQNLEDTALLASFDGYTVFGQSTSPEAAPEVAQKGQQVIIRKPVNWKQLRDVALQTLGKSKDLRVLAYLGAALLRTDGLRTFLETPVIASKWLETHWSETYPPVDGDGIARANALNCFADRMAVVERLRRIPLVMNAHGKVALRDLDIASGSLAPIAGEERLTAAQIDAAFAAVPFDELTALLEGVERAAAALVAIEKTVDTGIRDDLGPRATPDEAAEAAATAAAATGAAPDVAAKAGEAAAAKTLAAAAAAAAAAGRVAPKFEEVLIPLRQMEGELRARVAARKPESQAGEVAGRASGPSASGATTSVLSSRKGINSRQDAIRALDEVAEFFRTSEPSSPVPLFLERAKRLVSKNFLEVLADVAPDAIAQARSAGGLPPSSE